MGPAPGPAKSQPSSPNPQRSPRPSQADSHPKNKPQTHSAGFVLPQEPLAFLHELDVLVVPLPGTFYQLETLQQEILLLFQLLHVLQLQDRARRDVTPLLTKALSSPRSWFLHEAQRDMNMSRGLSPSPHEKPQRSRMMAAA